VGLPSGDADGLFSNGDAAARRWGLGWRLAEVAGKMPGVKYGSLAQGGARFGRLAVERSEPEDFVEQMWDKCK
jgi:hypothetical protein